MKTIIKHIYRAILLNCISVMSLSAQSHMLKFETLKPEQKNIHAFLCKRAVSKDHKDTKNRFSVVISFVFENGARKTFLIKDPDGKACFESVHPANAFRGKREECLKIIIKDEEVKKRIKNYINRGVRHAGARYETAERYRLGDSEVSFLYAINNCAREFQKKCVQLLAKKITHKLASIELHGFTTRDMCPCCLNYMDCFVEQSNGINLRSEKINNTIPENKGKGANENSNEDVFEHKSMSKQPHNEIKNGNANLSNDNGFQNFFECLFDQKNVKKYIPKDKQIPINFFISSLVELSSTEHKFSKYQDYHHKKEEEEEEEEEKKEDKIECSETIDGSRGNLYCIFLRDMKISPKLKKKTTSFSPRNIGIKENDYFALNMESNKPRYLGNWKDIKKYEKELKECTELGEWLCGSYDNHLEEGIRWSRISKNDSSVKSLDVPSMEELKQLKGSDLKPEDGFLFDPTTGKFSFDKKGDRNGGKNDWYYYRYNSTKDSKDKKCEWQHITEDYRLEPISNMSDGKNGNSNRRKPCTMPIISLKV